MYNTPAQAKWKILLFNPNTNVNTTQEMLDLTRMINDGNFLIDGRTASRGAPIILSDADLQVAHMEVSSLGDQLQLDGGDYDAIIVAAFGDPGVEALQQRLNIPVIGIGEATIREAAKGNRSFAIVTTTPELERSIRQQVEKSKVSGLVSIRLTNGEPSQIMANAERLEGALRALIERTIEEDQPEAIAVAGGPLAATAKKLSLAFPIDIIDPITAALNSLKNRLSLR